MGQKRVGVSNTRWWENYVVRYLVGTVVGAGIVVVLNGHSDSPFNGVLPSDIRSETLQVAGIFAAIGFAFCYIASAPILTLHATRPHLRLPQSKCGALSALAGLVLGGGLVWCAVAEPLSVTSISHYGTATLAFIVGVQVVLLLAAFIDKLTHVSEFYWDLSRARANTSATITEYVESYRHLREHGNAFSILIAEIVLGFIFFGLARPIDAIAVVTIWMLPASMCWFIGTALESKLARAPHE